LKSATAAMPGS